MICQFGGFQSQKWKQTHVAPGDLFMVRGTSQGRCFGPSASVRR